MEGSVDTTHDVTNDAFCAMVVPCYNEQDRFHTAAFSDFLAQGHPVRFCFVNDGSSDGTLEMLQAFQQLHPDHVTVLDLQPNGGKGEAVRRAMLHMMDQPGVTLVGFWDADLATPISALPRFIRAMEEHTQVAMVFGARVRMLGRRVNRNPLRHYLGRGFATAVSTMLGLPVYDTQCGAKLFRATPMLKSLLAQPFKSRWIFDVEIIARFMSAPGVGRAGAESTIYEMPLNEWRDVAGSKLSSTDFFRSVGELILIRRTYFASVFPGSSIRTRPLSGALETSAIGETNLR